MFVILTFDFVQNHLQIQCFIIVFRLISATTLNSEPMQDSTFFVNNNCLS